MSGFFDNMEGYAGADGDFEQEEAGKGKKIRYAEKKSFSVLKKKQMNRFRAAAERLHKGDVHYNSAMYLHFVLKLLCIVLGAVIIRIFIFEPTYVDGESMQTTLLDGEHVLVEKVSYWFNEPKRGDIVIVHFPNREELFVKRIIAVGGETISIEKGFVYINGEQIDESAYAGDWYGSIYRLIHTVGSVNGSYTVPYGHVFVMGDNRNESHDSRAEDVGAIPLEQIVGRARLVVWPLDKMRSVDKS